MAYTKEIGLRDYYNYYIENCKKYNSKYQDYKVFAKIIREANILIRDKILTNETFKIPYLMGELKIIKFENKFDLDKQYKWKVDYKKSKELGYIVYFGEQYGYRWKWIKNKALVSGKNYYHFKPVRLASRLINKTIKSGVDYYTYDK